MELERIRTDEPRREQWRLLNQFIYPSNINRYNRQIRQGDLDLDVVSYISSAIRQAQAYFTAAEHVPTDISPVLTYYGATNLLSAVLALRKGTLTGIKGHGMDLTFPALLGGARIADYSVTPWAGQADGLPLYWKEFCPSANIPGGVAWTLEEIFGSIPDLRGDFQTCYPTARVYSVPVEVCKTPKIQFDRILISNIVGYTSPLEAFSKVQGFSNTYLQPQVEPGATNVILHYRIGHKDQGTYSIFGEKHLQIVHEKGKLQCNPDQIILMLMGLFALGHLSRYYPRLWGPFILADETGEKAIVERFLHICQRYLPNLALNALYGKWLQFVNETEQIQTLETELTEEVLVRMLKNLQSKGERF